MGYRVQQPVPWLRSARIDSGGRKRFRQKPLGRQLGIPTTATLPPENQVFGVFAYGAVCCESHASSARAARRPPHLTITLSAHPGGGEGIRGALLDTNTGEFLRAGASTKLPAICTQQVRESFLSGREDIHSPQVARRHLQVLSQSSWRMQTGLGTSVLDCLDAYR